MKKTGIGGLISCRLASSRLPGKALRSIGERTVIDQVIMQVKAVPSLDHIVLCTTELPEDQALVDVGEAAGIGTFRGHVTDVMGRLLGAAERDGITTIVRFTGDNPLVCHLTAEAAIQHHLNTGAEFTRVTGLPVGTGVNVIDTAAMKRAHTLAEDLSESEYLAYYLDQPEFFRVEHVPAPAERHRPHYRLTVDTEEDLRLVCAIRSKIASPVIELGAVIALLDASPDLRAANADIRPKVTRDQVNARLRRP